MTSSCKEIPLEVWERHKDTILGLRFHEGLPLDSAKTSSRNVVQVMRDEHQFEATTAQYEAQLKRWRAAKYLKRQDWEALLPLYGTLERQGLKPRVRLGDQILEHKRIEKARRRYFPGKNRVPQEINELLPSAHTRLWRLEVWRHGQFSEYSDQEAEATIVDTLPSAVLSRGDANMDIEELPLPATLLPAQSDPIWTATQLEANTPSSQLTIFHPTLHSPQPDPDTLSQITSYFIREGVLPGSPFFHPTACVSSSPRNEADALVAQYEPQLLLSDEHTNTMLRRISRETPCLSSDTLLLPNYRGSSSIYNSIPPLVACQDEPRFVLSDANIKLMVQNMLQEPPNSICTNLASNTVQTVSERLASLLRDDFFEGECPDNSGAVSTTISLSEIHGRILLSIANNFAGLEGVPSAIILGVLKSSSEMTVNIQKYLQSGILSISKPLADNLFRAAIEAGDYDLVDMVLKTTHGQANEIDVNGIVSKLHGETFTALSLASYLHQPALVRMLIDYGAKVHVPGDSVSRSCALTSLYQEYCVIWENMQNKSRCPKNAEKAAEIAKLLLDKEPNAVVRLLKDDFFTTPCQLLEVLVQAVPPEHHHELFIPREVQRFGECGQGVWRLGSVVENLRPPVAIKFIKGLLAECNMKCAGSCAEKSSKDLNHLLTLSITKGSMDLTNYLLEHTRPTIGNLSAAIRGGQQNVVELMLEQSAITHGEAICLRNMSHQYGFTGRCRMPTTPLAEAIRTQNCGLVRHLEERGALDRISDPSLPDLQAAIIATVERGNLPYLKQLLERAPPRIGEALECAIVDAIELKHAKIADTLMVYLAGGDYAPYHISDQIMQSALEMQDKDLVYKTVRYFGSSELSSEHLEKAARWGDVSIIKYLYELEPIRILRYRSMALEVAIENNHVELATFLLDRGTKPVGLQKAIEVGSSELAQLLLRYSADPANEDAFSLALHASNTSFLKILSEAFALMYPNGKKGFGGKALATTFDARDSSSLEFLVGLNLDVNSIVPPHDSKLGHATTILYAINWCGKYDPVGIDMISQLLKAGARRDRQPLQLAVMSGNLQIVKLLLDNGFDVNQPTLERLSRTPLQRACELGNFQMVEYLLNQGAEVNAFPAVNGGGTALQLAAINGNVRVVRLLLDKEANIHADPALIHGRTALEAAAEHGRISVLNILLEKGADGYSMDAIEKAKSFAEKQKQRGCEERLKQALAACANGKQLSAKALLEARDNVNRVHPLTGTPLVSAAFRTHKGIVMLLLRNGADVNAANVHGTTALHQAASLGLVDMAQCLVLHGADL
ncbi:unnamed protein product [Clonostachys byssicola]|uniref:Clr5 domain-containing protein n=1 Tax=Clonostachys byssicola TaxID=160290 RepID=A0A9N9UCR8_9HYPO|nr:unnamed protein product [Clonostachys byssicola]